jgi:oligopeptide/dipeptide ABC transporter ATP-binding protein
VIAEVADRVAVMYAGRIVEEGPVRAIFRSPAHPYTKGLLASIPQGRSGERLVAIEGTVPNLGQLPPGCAFAPRCPNRMADCDRGVPARLEVSADHHARCLLAAPASAGATR